ncbi:MAG: hypothetical protein GQ570_04845 [Helicobacteraceae bacterium]|nr:hypothetical protein [Helicobacteraceae bacterium]
MKLLAILLFSAAALFAKPYYIQVMAVDKKENISKAFLKKVAKFGKYEIVKDNGYYKVWLGSYDGFQNAYNNLGSVKRGLDTCAFMTEGIVNCNVPKKRKISQRRVEEVALTPNVILREVAPINMTQNSSASSSEDSLVEVIELDTPATRDEAIRAMRKDIRKQEIGNAMAFYGNSKYYKFNKSF